MATTSTKRPLADAIRDAEAFLEEEWRSVVGYEGIYQVSDGGRVRRDPLAPASGPRAVAGYVLRPLPRGGYLRVGLYRDGHCRLVGVHQLVASAFIGPRPNGKEVNHIDGDKRNNAVHNLEYVTSSENHLHAFAIGLKRPPRGELQGAHKLNWPTVRLIRRCIEEGFGQVELSELFNISQSTVSEIKLNTIWVSDSGPCKRSIRSNNTSNATGVSWNGGRRAWVAELTVNGRRVMCRQFKTFEEACEARKNAERQHLGAVA